MIHDGSIVSVYGLFCLLIHIVQNTIIYLVDGIPDSLKSGIRPALSFWFLPLCWSYYIFIRVKLIRLLFFVFLHNFFKRAFFGNNYFLFINFFYLSFSFFCFKFVPDFAKRDPCFF